ncbi:MAG: single-stranded-DNA-specific exonuclease RecJ [Gammaproteobacteria bacterium]|nr:single-stranded-DNA-specific exonuclease RecJ [Gammaproteobacteria bacterium]MCH9744952.1 single-stranded-DNA-specific exonuclease RecJ [Gammaproteobacteria bacterium]
MNKKIVRRDIPDSISELDSFSPLLQRIYAARHIHAESDISRDIKDLLPYSGMMNIKKAAERLAFAIEEDQKIIIVGDFDADGATSTAVAMKALKAMGAKHVDYLVPNRFEYGYGLTPEIVDVAKTSEPDLIITVDNGIASIDGVKRANELGIEVIVTDHHLAPDVLPEAYTIVNPNQPGDTFGSKNLAGVGVIFYVMLALRAYLHKQGWFEKNDLEPPKMSKYLDLVAIGTVADVVPLDRNNRILVHHGVKRIRAKLACKGVLSLLTIGRRQPENIVASDLGYAIGPRLNAAGRLDDMSLGVNCLLVDKYEDGVVIANQLEQLNQERRALEIQMQQEAFDSVDSLRLNNQQLPMGLCLFEESWHQGIIGLVAARVKEKVSRPIIAFAQVDDHTLKGSARSVKGLHIRDTLDSIATKNPGLIDKFGGHAMAAGMSIGIDRFEEFRTIFHEEVAEKLCPNDLLGCVESDGALGPNDFTLEVAEMLREAGPWGQSFPKPLFDGTFYIKDQRLVGERHLKLMLQLPGSQFLLNGIAFNVDLENWPNQSCDCVKIAYHLDVNIYQGRRRLQLIVEELYETKVHEYAYAE